MKLCYCREDQCVNMAWTYHIDPDLDPVMTEGQGKVLDTFIEQNQCIVVCIFAFDQGLLLETVLLFLFYSFTYNRKSWSVLGRKLDKMPLLSACR